MMNTTSIKILKWPGQLRHIVDHLERTTDQDFINTPMENGSVKRRPATTPYPVFKGTVLLSRAEKTALDEFYDISQRHHFSFEETNSQATVYATFKDKPFVQAQRIVGSDVSYDVIIVLNDTTGIIENALAHGVEMEL